MHQRVDGTCGKYAVRQTGKQLGHKHGLRGEHGGRHQAHLGSQRRSVENGNIGHFAARSAGRGQNDQLAPRGKIGHVAVQIVHTGAFRSHGQHLGDVDDGAPAHGNDAAAALAFYALKNGVHHDVGRFARSERLLIHDRRRQIHGAEKGLIDVLVGQDDIVSRNAELFRKFTAGVEVMKFRFEL